MYRILVEMRMCVWSRFSHVWLYDLMYCSPPVSTIHGDTPGKNDGVNCHALLQRIFPTQGSNSGLPCSGWILYHLSHQGNPRILEWVAYPFSRGSSWLRNQTRVSCIAGRFFTSWVSKEAPEMRMIKTILVRSQIKMRDNVKWTEDIIVEKQRNHNLEIWTFLSLFRLYILHKIRTWIWRGAKCHGQMFVSPQNLYVEILIPGVMVFGDGGLC